MVKSLQNLLGSFHPLTSRYIATGRLADQCPGSFCTRLRILYQSLVEQLSCRAMQLWESILDVLGILSARLRRHQISDSVQSKRLTMVHFGDYAEAYWRFVNGGPETFYAQKYTVEFVASLVASKKVESVTSVCLSANLDAKVLPNGVHRVGVELYPEGQRARHRQLVEAVRRTNPTHLIVSSPILSLISWGVQSRIPVLPMLADSFRAGGLKARLKTRLLAILLNSPAIEVVANHSLAASLDLKRIGVDPRKIVPFDWPAIISPRSYDAKNAPPANQTFRMLYVGSVIESKGVGDAIRALSRLRKQGRNIQLTIIGRGDLESFERVSAIESVQQQVSFLGPRSHSEVISAMRNHDAVLVPSHWSYPEGLPMTLYEALCTRTPLITSDHPMFALKIRDQYNALVFPETNIAAFAECIDRLMSSPDLYAKLSQDAGHAAEGYLCPLKYDHLITSFLDPTARSELGKFSLDMYDYGR
jgi:glycosyl transferase family 1